MAYRGVVLARAAAAILLIASCDDGGRVGAEPEPEPVSEPAAESETESEPESAPEPESEAGSRSESESESRSRSESESGSRSESESESRSRSEPEPEPEPEPLEIRKTEKAMMVYAEPREDSAFRGKLVHGEAIAIYEHVEGPDCRGPWGRVALAGYICLDATEPTTHEPGVLPRLPKGRLVPFFYAKNRDPENPAPIWRSRKQMRGGAEPVGTLDEDHVYAFNWRRRGRDGGYYSDQRRRTIRGKDVKPLEPSDFTGRDLVAEPVPEGAVLAWTVQWPKTPRLETAHPDAEPAELLGYHEVVFVQDAPTTKRRAKFYPPLQGEGFFAAKQIRRWIPLVERPDGVGTDDVWLDIELSQQTLTVMRGDEPQFVTLVSSGTWKDPTPTGIWRFESKMALTDMRSKPNADDAYHVESVPWVMYFKGRYALHGAYWHNRFGRRTSHGCINLSAIDARKVYTLTEPHTPPGWVMVMEHPEDPGTVVRVRRRTEIPEDKRQPL